MKRTPLKRHTPIKKRRSKPRRGQPTAKEKAEARRQRYATAEGRCELHLHERCTPGVLPYEGDVFVRAHLVHLKSRGAGGDWSQENLRIGCYFCHIIAMHTQGRKIDE